MDGLVSLKRPKTEQDDCCCAPMDNEYGWGTCVRLEGDIVERLGLKGAAAGEKVTLQAAGYVQSVSLNDDSEHGKRMEVSIQLTDMAVGKQQSETPAADVLYGQE
jgi:hypothetical protein